jgi:hypothetical protein
VHTFTWKSSPAARMPAPRRSCTWRQLSKYVLSFSDPSHMLARASKCHNNQGSPRPGHAAPPESAAATDRRSCSHWQRMRGGLDPFKQCRVHTARAAAAAASTRREERNRGRSPAEGFLAIAEAHVVQPVDEIVLCPVSSRGHALPRASPPAALVAEPLERVLAKAVR